MRYPTVAPSFADKLRPVQFGKDANEMSEIALSISMLVAGGSAGTLAGKLASLWRGFGYWGVLFGGIIVGHFAGFVRL